MAIIEVSVSTELITHMMRSGHEVVPATCTKGLPEDAQLVDVIFHPEHSRVDLLFDSESATGGVLVVEYTESEGVRP